MDYKERRKLYKALMRDIARTVKQKIKEFINKENPFRIVDEFVLSFVRDTEQRIKNEVSDNDIAHLFDVDFVAKSALINRITHHPGLKEDFTVDSFNSQFADVQKRLKILYDISDWQISVVDNFGTGQNDVNVITVYDSKVAIDIVIANIEHNVNILNDFMQRNGYFLIRKIKANVSSKRFKNGNLIHLVYTPIIRKDISENIRENNSILLHMTSVENLESIQNDGLIPHERTGLNGIIYPARVYMFTESAQQEEWFSAYQYQLSTEKKDSSSYVVIEIEISKLPKSLKMFYDPLIGENAIYVEETIQPGWFGEIYNISKENQ